MTDIPVLSMMQPYAWLLSHGLLSIDDRCWSTRHRGPVAIHASKKFAYDYYEFLKSTTDLPLPEIHEFKHGGIVGLAHLIDCLPPTPSSHEMSMKDLHRSHLGAPGHCGFVFDSQKPLEFIPCSGKPGFFTVAADIERKLNAIDHGDREGLEQPQEISSTPGQGVSERRPANRAS